MITPDRYFRFVGGLSKQTRNYYHVWQIKEQEDNEGYSPLDNGHEGDITYDGENFAVHTTQHDNHIVLWGRQDDNGGLHGIGMVIYTDDYKQMLMRVYVDVDGEGEKRLEEYLVGIDRTIDSDGAFYSLRGLLDSLEYRYWPTAGDKLDRLTKEFV